MDFYSPQKPQHTIRVTQEIQAINRNFRSVENKRVVLHRALHQHPDDPRLHELKTRFTRPHHIRRGMKQGVFINYVRQDELFALELAENLLRARLRVWLDILNISLDEDWHAQMLTAMQTCGLMIAVISPHSMNNREARLERDRFAGMGKLLLPAVAKRADLNGEDFWLEPIDFSRDFGRGLYELRRLVQATPSPTT